MLAFLKFDDEDIYYPPKYRIDDISKWLAEIMTETGITGTFCVMGDRARVLKERGREDVLEAMAKHNLVSHQLGNQKPELVDLLAVSEWEDGMQKVREYEDRVVSDFKLAFGREPQGLSRHNIQWGPQQVALAGERSIPYLSNFIGVPDTEQPCWYVGALCFPCHIFETPSNAYGTATVPEFGCGDLRYTCDDAFNRRFEAMKKYVDECVQRGVELFHFFGAHPSRVRSRGFLEGRCLAGGKDRSVEEVGFLYGVMDDASQERAKANFRRMCEFIRDHPAIECKGVAEIREAFSSQPADITRDEMTVYAREMIELRQIPLHRTFSPAELLVGMAESLISAGTDAWLPDKVDRKNVMGPTESPTNGLEVSSITDKELIDCSRRVVAHVQETGFLPGNLPFNNNLVGIGQFAIVAARAYAALSRYDRYSVLNLDATARYPEVAWNVDAKVRHMIENKGRFDPDLSTDKLAKHARLQTWTLKPAWLNPPRGEPVHEGRIYL